MEQQLIVDCVGYTILDLNESAKTTPSGALKFRGKFQEANAINKNRRMYPESVLRSNVERLKEAVENRGYDATRIFMRENPKVRDQIMKDVRKRMKEVVADSASE